jgi:hypothetical protein
MKVQINGSNRRTFQIIDYLNSYLETQRFQTVAAAISAAPQPPLNSASPKTKHQLQNTHIAIGAEETWSYVTRSLDGSPVHLISCFVAFKPLLDSFSVLDRIEFFFSYEFTLVTVLAGPCVSVERLSR